MAKKTVVKKEKSVSKKATKEKVMKKPKSRRVSRMSTNKLIVEHTLVPLHTKLTDKEAQELLKQHNITIKELPKIFIDDPAIRHLEVKENDIVKIIRVSPTAGKSIFYRGVIDE
jgi:DNA-directed RNA polymerase subunit H